MSDLLSENLELREELGKCFNKTPGSVGKLLFNKVSLRFMS